MSERQLINILDAYIGLLNIRYSGLKALFENTYTGSMVIALVVEGIAKSSRYICLSFQNLHPLLNEAPWPNGKALLSGGKDCGFESHRCRPFCRRLVGFFLRLSASFCLSSHLVRIRSSDREACQRGHSLEFTLAQF